MLALVLRIAPLCHCMLAQDYFAIMFVATTSGYSTPFVSKPFVFDSTAPYLRE
jgi:hypothetical protein